MPDLAADDALADRLIAFMNDLERDHAKIRPAADGKGGFEIVTCLESTFSYAIWGATRLEVARYYLESTVRAYSYLIERRNTAFGYVFGRLGIGGGWRTKEERRLLWNRCERLRAWDRENLPSRIRED